MTTLKLTLIVLPIVEIAIFIWLIIRNDLRRKRKCEDPVPIDDLPGHYEDYELSEWPFINP